MAARLLRHREYQGVNTLAQSLSQRSGMPLVLHDEVAEQHASETVVVEKQVGVDCAAAGSPSQSSSPSTVQWLPSPRAIMRGQPTRPRCTAIRWRQRLVGPSGNRSASTGTGSRVWTRSLASSRWLLHGWLLPQPVVPVLLSSAIRRAASQRRSQLRQRRRSRASWQQLVGCQRYLYSKYTAVQLYSCTTAAYSVVFGDYMYRTVLAIHFCRTQYNHLYRTTYYHQTIILARPI
jgi:hypothetical protein